MCVIYITKNDFFKKGKTIYHVDRILRETGEVVYNGFSEIYVNAYVKDGSPTSELMTIFTQSDAYDDRKFPATSRRKCYFKEDEKGVSEVCEIMQEVMQEVKQEGIAQGIEEGRIELTMQLYRDQKLSLKDACTYLGITEEEFEELERKASER